VSDAALHVPSEFCRNAGNKETLQDEDAVIDGAVGLIEHMCGHLETPDLDGLEVLDFGCGVRFAQAIVNRGLAIERYVGVDVDREMIDFLAANGAHPRREFVHLDAHNALYNPTGRPLAEVSEMLPIEGRQFDVICLFSVFTHLAPHDYVAVLRLLRRFVRPTGRLFYTLFIDEKTAGGFGLIDGFSRALSATSDPDVQRAFSRRIHSGVSPAPAGFRDLDPSRPLLYALYSREHALELIEGTGWTVLSLSPPDRLLQHHILCAPS
jgi:SAM-dependent methyltransferase